MSNGKEIFVYIVLDGVNHLVGRLWSTFVRSRECASFEYDKSWLQNSNRFALEPALGLSEGLFYTEAGQSIFGAIGDSSPDRWGRALMRRAVMEEAKRKKQTPRTLHEIDYLLGVSDKSRLGALRFSEKVGGKFLSNNIKNNIPPLFMLPKLLSATERFLNDDKGSDIKLLLAPGSSLGGARPKASVLGSWPSLIHSEISSKRRLG